MRRYGNNEAQRGYYKSIVTGIQHGLHSVIAIEREAIPVLFHTSPTASSTRAVLAATLNYAWSAWYVPCDCKASTALTFYIASVDLDECIERLYKKELLAEAVVEAICAKAKELLMKESNVVHIAAPVTVVGDIHGQFFDMIEIFKIGGFCPDTNYLFLGKTFLKLVLPSLF